MSTTSSDYLQHGLEDLQEFAEESAASMRLGAEDLRCDDFVVAVATVQLADVVDETVVENHAIGQISVHQLVRKIANSFKILPILLRHAPDINLTIGIRTYFPWCGWPQVIG